MNPPGMKEAAMSAQATIREGEQRTDLYGVRGWLLLLCLYLMIAMPLVALLGTIGALQRAIAAPALRGALLAEVVLEIALAVFAAYAGWALYRMRPNAVKIAKFYFITMLTLSNFGLGIVLVSALVVSRNQDNALLNTLQGPAAVASIRQAILAAVWLVYLLRSKRVRATFPKA